MRRISSRVLLIILATLVGSSGAVAQNLIVNGDFDTDIEGWSGLSSSIHSASWSPVDADGSDESGSLRVLNSWELDQGCCVRVSQCVPVTPGLIYQASGAFMLPGDQSHRGRGAIRFALHSAPNCDSTGELSPWFVSDVVPGVWQTITPRAFLAFSWVESVRVDFGFHKIGEGGSLAFHLDDAVLEPAICVSSDSTLCLGNGRFRIRGMWTKPDGTTGFAHMVQLTPDTGYLWFFKPSNIEAIVKVLNGCGVNNRYWVFAGGLTNVEVRLLVEDLERAAFKAYTNPQGKPFQPIQDTAAFATCP